MAAARPERDRSARSELKDTERLNADPPATPAHIDDAPGALRGAVRPGDGVRDGRRRLLSGRRRLRPLTLPPRSECMSAAVVGAPRIDRRMHA